MPRSECTNSEGAEIGREAKVGWLPLPAPVLNDKLKCAPFFSYHGLHARHSTWYVDAPQVAESVSIQFEFVTWVTP